MINLFIIQLVSCWLNDDTKEEIKPKKKIIDNAFLLTEKLLKESIDATKGKEISEDFLSKIKV